MSWPETCSYYKGGYSDLTAFVITVTVLHFLFFGGAVGYYMIVTRMDFAQRYKVELPAGGRANKEGVLKEAWVDAVLGTLVKVPVAAAVMWWVVGGYDVCEGFKSWERVAAEHVLSMVFTDTTFYWMHRALHTRYLYARVHKQHHEFKTLEPVCAEYDHPLEDLLNVVSTTGGPLLLSSHPVTMCLHMGLRIWQSVDAHSGYALPLPLSIWNTGPSAWSSAKRHAYHHGVNVGNVHGGISTSRHVANRSKVLRKKLSVVEGSVCLLPSGGSAYFSTIKRSQKKNKLP
eukprot:TRINITY_DN12444_c0_g1_i1.p1 TRINITY_DN12444_c0_g1~~TRINITY_DN12444_c0_g1_i1.p1  ORF type:complete len:304 (+),score=47.29 TRINITY_DN12444_c0_g1_i1:53-913(+)